MTQGLRGVGGWLMFLILSLTVFGPLAALFTLVFIFTATALAPTLPSSFVSYAIVEALVVVPYAVWGITIGVKLWKLRPNAVKSAKQFLTSGTIPFVVIVNLLPWILLSPELRTNQSGPNTVGSIIGGLGAALAWNAYLKKSRRVANTYPQG